MWTLSINGAHWGGRGPNVSLHETREEAEAKLAGYVAKNWDDMQDGDMPEDDDEAVERYFANVEDETYEIGLVTNAAMEGEPDGPFVTSEYRVRKDLPFAEAEATAKVNEELLAAVETALAHLKQLTVGWTPTEDILLRAIKNATKGKE